MGRHTTAAVIALVALVALVPGTVAAHEPPDDRFDAPLPLSLLYAGAAAAVGATAVVLGVAGDRVGTVGETVVGRIHERVGTVLGAVARLGFLACAALVVVGGVFGPTDPDVNVGTVLFWALWLKGVAVLAALVGDPWRVLSPWETVYDGLVRIAPDTLGRDAYPERLGSWPAVAGFVAIVGVAENLTSVPADPRATAALVGGYWLVMLLGGVAFGPTWFRQADCFAVFYRLFGRVAPIRVIRGGAHTAAQDDRGSSAPSATGARTDGAGAYRVIVRPPWRGATAPVSDLAAAALVVAAIYAVSLDGLSATIEYQYLLAWVGVTFGIGPGVEFATYFAGLAAFLGGLVLVAGASDRLAGSDGRLGGSVLAFAPALLPIAVSYEIAHSYPGLVWNATRLVFSALPVAAVGADPLGWLPLPAFWASQVVLITVGHVVSVVAAHRVTRRRYGDAGAAGRGHAPLALCMIGYTVVTLWIVSLPAVN
ncbi:hypothetical protein [Halorientalis halophila]|uniref:hypothetical protein n=1 Tax=Halorientalis halophila TaxID=3108499 RepID=UPI00300808E8